MKLPVSILILIFGIDFRFCVKCDENFENLPDFETDRWKLEFADFQHGLQMFNEEGRLINLTIDTKPPEEEHAGSPEGVKFYLYTRRNPIKPQRLGREEEKLRASFYDRTKPTFLLTHGWLGNRENEACTLVRNAYLKKNHCNVIVVDWGSKAVQSYLWSVAQVPNVGMVIARMISYLRGKGYLKLEETTLVGHSLGAHVMGIAGHLLKGQIQNIIGMDPALPLFKHASIGQRISHRDAKNVQIIHTNAGLLGCEDALGHVDFYVNGGTNQPGCPNDILGVCSHMRAIGIFAESINNPGGFWALECVSTSTVTMERCVGPKVTLLGGPRPYPKSRGIFYLPTRAKSPFAIRILIKDYLSKYRG